LTWKETVALYRLTLDGAAAQFSAAIQRVPIDPIDTVAAQDGKRKQRLRLNASRRTSFSVTV
jgi:hypothetical protein